MRPSPPSVGSQPAGGHRRYSRLWAAIGGAWITWAQAQSAKPAPATVIDQPEEPVAFEAVRPGPPSPVSREALPENQKLPDLTAVSSWVVPPIQWGGNTSSSYGWNSASEAGSSFNQSQTLNLRASSYIYQPWYAQVAGDIGLLSGTSKQGGSEVNSNSRSSAVTYGGNLSLFPVSRFPFQGFFQTSDSRASANATGSQYTATRMGARQSYRPAEGRENYNGSVDRSILTSGSVRSIVDALQGSFSTSFDEHSISSNARYSRNVGDVSGQGSNLFSVSGSHSWRPDEELMVATSANFTNNQINLLTGTGMSVNNSQIMQAGSSVNWLPDEDLPLTINGGGNILHIKTSTALDQATLSNLNGYGNASYRFSDNLSGIAGLMMAQDTSAGVSRFSSIQTASLSYSGNPLRFGEYSYNWGSSAGITNQVISKSPGNRSLFGQLQHSLARDIAISESSNVGLHANQGFSITSNSTSGQTGVITHGAGASWRLGFGDNLQSSMSATISDAMSLGEFSSHSRSLSTQGNLQALLSSRSSLSANLNFILSQQLKTPQAVTTISPVTPTSQTPTVSSSNTLSGSGQISYSHRSPFDISNLVYTASLQINASQTNLRVVSGDPNAMPWQTGAVLLQNANYRYGRLVFQATASIASFNGKKNASLLFTISREIGDF